MVGSGVLGWIGKRGAGGGPVLKPAKITVQPVAFALFQENGLLEIGGAAVQDAKSTVWQLKAADGTWKDTAFTSVKLSWPGAFGDDSTYRLKVTGEDGKPVYSNEVPVYNVYLRIQDDTAPAAAIKVDNTHYTWTTAQGGKYVGALYFRTKDNSSFTPPGATGGRAAVTWATNNQTVAPVTGTGAPGSGNVQASGQWRPAMVSAGKATVTAAVGNLKSTVEITVT